MYNLGMLRPRGVEPYATQQKRKASSVGEFVAPIYAYMGIDERRYYRWIPGPLLTWYYVLFPYLLVGAELAALTLNTIEPL